MNRVTKWDEPPSSQTCFVWLQMKHALVQRGHEFVQKWKVSVSSCTPIHSRKWKSDVFADFKSIGIQDVIKDFKILYPVYSPRSGRTPLLAAVRNGRLDLVRTLCACGTWWRGEGGAPWDCEEHDETNLLGVLVAHICWVELYINHTYIHIYIYTYWDDHGPWAGIKFWSNQYSSISWNDIAGLKHCDA